MSPKLNSPLRTLKQALDDYRASTFRLADRRTVPADFEHYATLDTLYRATLAQHILRNFVGD